jgi:EpsI family protein
MAALCAAIFIFYPSLLALFHRWLEPVSYFDHAIFVPFVCLWMYSRSRKETPRTPGLSSLFSVPSFAFLLFALLLQFFGAAHQGAGVVLSIWAAVLWFGGTPSFKAHRWALLYLLLLIPIPTFFMAQLTLGMRELSTTLSAAALHAIMSLFGLPFARLGNELDFGNHQVTIVDACSGTNTLLMVIAVGMLLVYLESSRLRGWLITLLLVPTAIVANLIRILVLCLFVALGKEEFAFGSGHALIGLTTVGMAVAILAFGVRLPKSWEARWNEKFPPPAVSEKNQAENNPTPTEQSRFEFRLRTLTVLFVFGALIALRIESSESLDTVAKKQSLPQVSFSNWRTTELPMDETTYDIIGTRDAHMYRFDPVPSLVDPTAAKKTPLPIYFYWVHSDNSRKIGHPPELCYQADAYEILTKTQTQIEINGRTLPINRLVVKRDNYSLLVYYWYRIDGVETASYLEQQFRAVWNQLKHFAFLGGNREGTMIRLSTEIDNHISNAAATSDAESRLKNWIIEQDK